MTSFEQWYAQNRASYGLPENIEQFKAAHVFKKFEYYRTYWNTLGIDVLTSYSVGYRIKYLYELKKINSFEHQDWTSLDTMSDHELKVWQASNNAELNFVRVGETFLIKAVTYFGTLEELLQATTLDVFGIVNSYINQ